MCERMPEMTDHSVIAIANGFVSGRVKGALERVRQGCG